MTMLATTMTGRMRTTDDPKDMAPRYVSVAVSWDLDDPMAITFVFTPLDGAPAQTWTVGRDLAYIGLAAIIGVGRGNFKVGSRADAYVIRLAADDRPDFVADMYLPREQMHWILQESQNICPTASPAEYAAIEKALDEALAEILGEEDAA